MTEAYRARMWTTRDQDARAAALDGIAAGAALRVLYDGTLLSSAWWHSLAVRWGIGATTAELMTRTLLRKSASRERVTLSKKRKTRWACGNCGRLGHNIRTCAHQ